MFQLTTVNIIFMCLIGALIFIEAFFSGIKNSSLATLHKRDRNNFWDIFNILSSASGLYKIIENILWFGMLAAMVAWTNSAGFIKLEGIPFWVQLFIILLVFDFLNFILHLWSHQSNWLWLTHELHHSAERISLFTHWRSHPLKTFLKPRFFLLFVFGPSEALVAAVMVREFFVLSNHMRWDSDWGWIGRYVLVSPKMHYLHHEVNSLRCNYGQMFVLWDRMFKTYRAPERSINEMSYGIANYRFKNRNLASEYLIPVVDFYTYPIKRAREWRRSRYKAQSQANAGEDFTPSPSSDVTHKTY